MNQLFRPDTDHNGELPLNTNLPKMNDRLDKGLSSWSLISFRVSLNAGKEKALKIVTTDPNTASKTQMTIIALLFSAAALWASTITVVRPLDSY